MSKRIKSIRRPEIVHVEGTIYDGHMEMPEAMEKLAEDLESN